MFTCQIKSTVNWQALPDVICLLLSQLFKLLPPAHVVNGNVMFSVMYVYVNGEGNMFLLKLFFLRLPFPLLKLVCVNPPPFAYHMGTLDLHGPLQICLLGTSLQPTTWNSTPPHQPQTRHIKILDPFLVQAHTSSGKWAVGFRLKGFLDILMSTPVHL